MKFSLHSLRLCAFAFNYISHLIQDTVLATFQRKETTKDAKAQRAKKPSIFSALNWKEYILVLPCVSFFGAVKSSLLHLLFPQLCLHCKSELPQSHKLLCPACYSLLDFLEPTGRCRYCFTENEKPCDKCRQKRPSVDFVASCFEYTGPAQSLITQFKYGDSPGLATSLGGFLLLQFDALDWPLPDVITFVPQSFIKATSRGYNQSKLLADVCGNLLSRPVYALLAKTMSTISQSRLAKDKREAMPQDLFIAKQPHHITGKAILLIDDVYTTGTTIECCAAAIRQHSPSHIYVLTICHA